MFFSENSPELKKYLSWILQTPVSALQETLVVTGRQIRERVVGGDIKRVGPSVAKPPENISSQVSG